MRRHRIVWRAVFVSYVALVAFGVTVLASEAARPW